MDQQQAVPKARSLENLKATKRYGEEEYRFYVFQGGIIQAFECPHGIPYGSPQEKRVACKKLPTFDLQELFVMLTGKTADEIGIVLIT